SKKFPIRFGKSPSTYKNALRENRRALSLIVRLRSTAGAAERRFDETAIATLRSRKNQSSRACLMGRAGRAKPGVLLLARSWMHLLPMLRGYWQPRGRIRFGDEASVAS